MDFFDAVNKRRSVRRFTDTPVPESVMRKCLKASVLAANSSNLQPWEFYGLEMRKRKKRLLKRVSLRMQQKLPKKSSFLFLELTHGKETVI